MKSRKFLYGFLSGIGFSILTVFGLFFIYYSMMTKSGVAEEKVRSRLSAPHIPEYCKECYTPNFGELSLTNMEGKKINLSDFSGSPIFLNFWQTTCIPCLAEMESINTLSLKTPNVKFLLVSNESLEKVQEFIEKRDYNFEVFVTPDGEFNS